MAMCYLFRTGMHDVESSRSRRDRQGAAADPDDTPSGWSRDHDTTSGVFEDALDSAGDDTQRIRMPYDLYPDFVGRHERLDALLDIVSRSRHRGELAFVLLVGEAGMGKSRAIKELGRCLKRRYPDTRILTGGADGTGVPYTAFARLFARRFGITPGQDAEARRQRILRTVSEVLPSDRVTEVAHLLAHLMRIPMQGSPVVGPLAASPQQLETRMFIAVRRFLAADAAAGPLVLVLEDLEACSPETINLIHYLAVGLRAAPVVLLGSARASLFQRHPSFGDTDVPLARIDLPPLSSDDAALLLRDLCRPLESIPSGLEAHARALGGSPRALLELMRLLLESEIVVRSDTSSWALDNDRLAAIKLPDSYEELVALRLEVMDPAERDLLYMAAIIGETFWLDAVVALVRARHLDPAHPEGPTLGEIAASGDRSRVAVSAALETLEEREWILAVDESSVPGEREYRFAQPHVRTLIAARIPDAERRAYHKAAAQWLELRPEGGRPLAGEEIARHLEGAGLVAEAAERYRRAADAARTSYFNQRAIRLYMAALRCIGDRDLVARMRLWHDLGAVFELKGDFEAALGAFERMLRLAWVVASRGKAALAFSKMGRVWRRRGDLRLALEHLSRAAELFELAGDHPGIAGALDDTGRVLYLLGRYDEAFEAACAGLERRSDAEPLALAMSLSNLGNIQRARGLLAEARACHQQALGLRRAAGDRSAVISSLNNIAVLDYEHGDLSAARAGWSLALSEAEDIGALPLCALALQNLGELALAEGRHEEARRHLDEALTIAGDIEDRRLQVEAMRNLALVEDALGHADSAQALARRSLDIAAAAGLRDGQGRALLCLGQVLSSRYDGRCAAPEPAARAARRCYEQGVHLLRELGNESELARGLEQYGRYRLERGDGEGGRALLGEALGIYSKLGMKRGRQLERLLRA